METAIYSTLGLLLVSLLSGLAYLAIKYPLIYVELGKKLVIGLVGAMLVGLGFSAGMTTTMTIAQSHISPDRTGAFLSAMNSIQISGGIIGFGLLALGFFLYLLAKIGADIYRHERREDGRDGQGE